mgnify:CR=1 FL=1
MDINTLIFIGILCLIFGIVYIIIYIYFELRKPSKYQKKYEQLLDFNNFIIRNYTMKSEEKMILSYLKHKNKEKIELKNNIDIEMFKEDVLSDLDLM